MLISPETKRIYQILYLYLKSVFDICISLNCKNKKFPFLQAFVCNEVQLKKESIILGNKVCMVASCLFVCSFDQMLIAKLFLNFTESVTPGPFAAERKFKKQKSNAKDRNSVFKKCEILSSVNLIVVLS